MSATVFLFTLDESSFSRARRLVHCLRLLKLQIYQPSNLCTPLALLHISLLITTLQWTLFTASNSDPGGV